MNDVFMIYFMDVVVLVCRDLDRDFLLGWILGGLHFFQHVCYCYVW